MADEKSQSEPSRESGCGVLGVAFALALLVGSIAGLWLIRASPARADDILGELFAMRELPFGLSVSHAAVLPSGERFVRWQDPAAEPEEEPPQERKQEGGKPRSSESPSPPKPPPDPPPAKEPGRPPREVVLVNYPRSGLESIQSAMRVGGGGMGEGPMGPGGPGGGPGGGFFSGGQGERVAMDAGQLAWGELLVRYVHERTLLGPRGFRDIVRVNLSLGGRYCVLLLRWSLNYPASLERTEELIRAFAPLPEEQRSS
jgi:hypothetical protein